MSRMPSFDGCRPGAPTTVHTAQWAKPGRPYQVPSNHKWNLQPVDDAVASMWRTVPRVKYFMKVQYFCAGVCEPAWIFRSALSGTCAGAGGRRTEVAGGHWEPRRTPLFGNVPVGANNRRVYSYVHSGTKLHHKATCFAKMDSLACSCSRHLGIPHSNSHFCALSSQKSES